MRTSYSDKTEVIYHPFRTWQAYRKCTEARYPVYHIYSTIFRSIISIDHEAYGVESHQFVVTNRSVTKNQYTGFGFVCSCNEVARMLRATYVPIVRMHGVYPTPSNTCSLAQAFPNRAFHRSRCYQTLCRCTIVRKSRIISRLIVTRSVCFSLLHSIPFTRHNFQENIKYNTKFFSLLNFSQS